MINQRFIAVPGDIDGFDFEKRRWSNQELREWATVVSCPTCGAGIYRQCIGRNGVNSKAPHEERLKKADFHRNLMSYEEMNEATLAEEERKAQ